MSLMYSHRDSELWSVIQVDDVDTAYFKGSYLHLVGITEESHER
jgi:hypothetical protein